MSDELAFHENEDASDDPLDVARQDPTTHMTFDGNALLDALRVSGAWLDLHIAQVNALNVFPVPDGDTGTNMSLTMRAALDEANDCSPTSVGELARVVAHGALMGARGNSGVILSQVLRGFARALDGKDTLDPDDFARALKEGSATAYKGVMKPVEGTILTVAREAADAAERVVSTGADLRQTLEDTVSAAQESLARTPDLLPVLAEAGVVDAGGKGLTLILEGILRHMRGEGVEAPPVSEAVVEHAHPPEGDYNYDTQFIIKGSALSIETIRQQIATMGDSVLVVGDSETVKVHVHSDHPGRVLDYGVSQGHITSVIVENMQLQYEQFRAASPDAGEEPGPPAPSMLIPTSAQRLSHISVIAVVSGEGLGRIFESLGVDATVSGGQTMNPSTQDLLSAIERAPAEEIVILPNNKNIILAAQQAKELAKKQAVVVPTKTVPQGISALLAFNYQADLDTNLKLMSEASTQVQTAEITKAVRSAQVNGLSIAAGQFIGLLNGDLTTVGETISSVVEELLDTMDVAEYEILTVYHGQDVAPEEAAELAGSLRRQYPDLEIEDLSGGQAHYYYIISAE